MNRKIRVTVWNEFRHERDVKHPSRTVYPDGMHAVIAKALAAEPDFERYEIVRSVIDECLDMTLDYRQSGHPGGSRSKAHMLTALLLSGAMRWDIRRPWLRYGDRFVLSAGHVAPLAYSTLAVLNEGLRARLFAFGVGSDVNTLFLDKLASGNRGQAARRAGAGEQHQEQEH